jgi:hypothetical protein
LAAPGSERAPRSERHSVMQRRRDQAEVSRRGHLRHSAPTEWLCAIAPFRSIGSLTAGGRSISTSLSASGPSSSVFEVASHNRSWPLPSPDRCAPAATWVSASCAKRTIILSVGGQPPGPGAERNFLFLLAQSRACASLSTTTLNAGSVPRRLKALHWAAALIPASLMPFSHCKTPSLRQSARLPFFPHGRLVR